MNAHEVIESLKLKPLLMEGGFFRETYRADETVLRHQSSDREQTTKCICTAIYYLLTPETVSILHRLPTDEIYHFYLGDPVVMLQLHPNGRSEIVTLGPHLDQGEQVQVVVPKGTWQGSFLKPGGVFGLMGTTMAPGFDYEDFEAGERPILIQKYPAQEELITRLAK